MDGSNGRPNHAANAETGRSRGSNVKRKGAEENTIENRKTRVMVSFFGGMRELSGTPVAELTLREGAVVADLMSEVRSHFPRLWARLERGIREGYISILLEGRNIASLEGLETCLPDGCKIAFLPPLAGG